MRASCKKFKLLAISRFARATLIFSFLALITGCGGGGGGGASLSNNAALADLILSFVELDQTFQPSQTDYTASVNFLRHAVTVTPTSEDANASITVNGTSANSGQPSQQIDLAAGANSLITIAVTSEDGGTMETYTVDVTRQAVAAFAQQAYVKASNTDQDDQFAQSVALSGDTLAVGAYLEDSSASGVDPVDQGNDGTNALAHNAGAVYVFTRDAGGVWSQQAYLKASNPDQDDEFGYSVALSGDTLAVSAMKEDSSASGIDPVDAGNDATNGLAHDAGAVYVFTRDMGGTWSQQAYIKASNPDMGDWFGFSLALEDDTLVVGARREDSSATGVNPMDTGNDVTNGINHNAGAAYVFTRDMGGTWSQQAYVKSSNPGQSDFFGWSVALSGDTLAVGAAFESSDAMGVDGDGANDNAGAAGAAYVFTRDGGGTWSQQAYVKASNTEANDHFGSSVALNGDTLAVGAPPEDSSAVGVDPADQANDASGVNYNAGAVYVFGRSAVGVWSQQAYIKASNTDSPARFGSSLAMTGNTLAVGAYAEASNAMNVNGDQNNTLANLSGAVYVFARDASSTWSQIAYVKASNTGASDNFGLSVAMQNDTLAVGAPAEDSIDTGIDGDQLDDTASSSGAAYVRR